MAEEHKQLLEYLQLDGDDVKGFSLDSLTEGSKSMDNQAQPSNGGGDDDGISSAAPISSPLFCLEEASLQINKEKNKESLKRKLMFRRTVNELVDLGIYPSHTPAAFAEQSKHLQRAQTGDKLSKKILCRPDRTLLVQHNILNECKADSSLIGKIGQLKRARLTDELNEKIAHRPGPLELVFEDILVVDQSIKDAIIEGKLEYHKTQEGVGVPAIQKIPYEVESPKSGASSPEPSPSDESDSPSNLGAVAMSPPCLLVQPSTDFVRNTLPVTNGSPLLQSTASAAVANTAVPPGAASLAVTKASVMVATPGSQSLGQPALTSSAVATAKPGCFVRSNGRVNKKSKPKPQTKPRVIKFHEYKGPPPPPPVPPAPQLPQMPAYSPSPPRSPLSLHTKNTFSNGLFPFANTSAKGDVTPQGQLQKSAGISDTQYNLLLQQQQLFLQCQVEFPQKSLPVLVPVQALHQQQQQQSQVKDNNVSQATVTPSSMTTHYINGAHATPMSSPMKSHPKVVLSKSFPNLQDMKVADLKAELKQRNLPVSGSKCQLIERLKGCQEEGRPNGFLMGMTHQAAYFSLSGMKNSPSAASEFEPLGGVGSINASSPIYSPVQFGLVPSSSQRDHSDDTMTSSSMPMDTVESTSTSSPRAPPIPSSSHEDIVRKQQKQIEELQKELLRSQLELQKQQLQAAAMSASSSVSAASAVLCSPPTTQSLQVMPSLTGLPQVMPAEAVTVTRPTGGSNIVVMSQSSAPDKRSLLITPIGRHLAGRKVQLQAAQPVTTTSDERDAPHQCHGGAPVSSSKVASVFTYPLGAVTSHANEQQGVLRVTMAIPSVSSVTTNGQAPSSRKPDPHSVDDVLEILIRTGELPASAACETPGSLASTSAAIAASCLRASPTRRMPAVAPHGSSTCTSEKKSIHGTSFTAREFAMSDIDLIHTVSASQSPTSMDWADTDCSNPCVSVKIEPGLSDSNQEGVITCNGTDSTEDAALSWSKWSGHNTVKKETDSPPWIQDGIEHSLGTLDFREDAENSLDWLDVPLQGIGTMSVSCATPTHAANIPLTFTNDPLLTPVSHSVPDIFNMDDSDFCMPGDNTVDGGIDWEKLLMKKPSSDKTCNDYGNRC